MIREAVLALTGDAVTDPSWRTCRRKSGRHISKMTYYLAVITRFIYPRVVITDRPGLGLIEVDVDEFRAPLIDLHLSGLVSSRMRHVIKRYLKRAGFLDVDVVHLLEGGELGVRLVAYGKHPQDTGADARKLAVLEGAIQETLSRKVDGLVPHPSQADPELLRMMLSCEEPSMKRVFYKMA
jgi:hypothetical protein